MENEQQQYASHWRKRRYYVSDDGFIKPVQGSPVEEYDPFESFYAGPRTSQPRYLHTDLAGLDTDDTRAIEDFVNTWGLLGLFQHYLRRVQTGPLDPKPPRSMGGLP